LMQARTRPGDLEATRNQADRQAFGENGSVACMPLTGRMKGVFSDAHSRCMANTRKNGFNSSFVSKWKPMTSLAGGISTYARAASEGAQSAAVFL